MAERTFNSNSATCVQWEALLADALDGLLKPEDEAIFHAHLAVCPACSALFEEARRGASGWNFSRLSRRFRPVCWTNTCPNRPGT